MENPEKEPILPIADEATIADGKSIAMIAYLTVVGLIIAIILNNDKRNAFAAFHVRQSLGIAVFGLVLGIINVIPVLGWIISMIGFILVFVMWVVGLINALNGKMKPVPILGSQFEQWFKGVN